MLTSIGIYYSTITRTSEIVITFCCALYNGARRRELITVERERERVLENILIRHVWMQWIGNMLGELMQGRS